MTFDGDSGLYGLRFEESEEECMRIDGKTMEGIFRSEFGEAAVRHFEKLMEYVSFVAALPGKAQAVQFRCSGDELRQETEALDRARTIKHDAAIASLSILGRMGERLGLSPLFDMPIETVDRGDIAQAIFEFVKYLLDNDEYGIVNNP